MSHLEKNEIEKLATVFDSFLVSKTAVALSTMLGDSFKHNVKVLESGVSKLKSIKMEPDEMKICSVHLSGQGDTEISLLYTIKEKHAKKIAAKLLCQESVEEIDELGQSAVSEVGNIMTGSFFNALSADTGFKVDLSTPEFLRDSLSTVVDDKAKEIILPVDNIVLTDIEFLGTDSGIKLHMIIMQDGNNTRKVLSNAK